MDYVEDNAYKAMVDIFATLTTEEEIYFDGYFAADICKVNGKTSVNPCFLGFSSSAITLVYLNATLTRERVQTIPASSIEQVKRKKMFLAKGFYLHLKCTDGATYVIGVDPTLKYLPHQSDNVEKFLRQYHL